MAQTDDRTKPGRWKTIVLVLSLGMNLGLVGLIAGAAVRGPSGGGFGVPVEGFRTIVQSMEAGHGDRVRADLRGKRGELRSARNELREIRQSFLSLLRSDDFSPENLAVLFQRQAEVLQGLGVEAQAVLIERISSMTLAERTAMADRLEEQFAKRRRR